MSFRRFLANRKKRKDEEMEAVIKARQWRARLDELSAEEIMALIQRKR